MSRNEVDLPPPGPRAPPVFLERQSYRRRRLGDSARLFPLLGVALFLVPLLWPTGQDGNVPMSQAITYIFGAWGFLIVLTALFGLAMRRWGQPEATAATRPD